MEAGNSPQMIFKHYRELVRAVDAKQWFSIAPGQDGKIIFFERPKIEGLAGAAETAKVAVTN
jgi:hypothetical protein